MLLLIIDQQDTLYTQTLKSLANVKITVLLSLKSLEALKLSDVCRGLPVQTDTLDAQSLSHSYYNLFGWNKPKKKKKKKLLRLHCGDKGDTVFKRVVIIV